jgi:hypothetical protein
MSFQSGLKASDALVAELNNVFAGICLRVDNNA